MKTHCDLPVDQTLKYRHVSVLVPVWSISIKSIYRAAWAKHGRLFKCFRPTIFYYSAKWIVQNCKWYFVCERADKNGEFQFYELGLVIRAIYSLLLHNQNNGWLHKFNALYYRVYTNNQIACEKIVEVFRLLTYKKHVLLNQRLFVWGGRPPQLQESEKKFQSAVQMADDEMDADFAHLTWGNLARWKRWKHCSFLRQGSNYGSAWHGAARIRRWVYQSVGRDLVA